MSSDPIPASMPRVLPGPNPFGLDPSCDLPATPPEGVPGWSENMFIQFWDPEHGTGMWSHVGRTFDDPTLIRAVLAVYVQHGELLVSRSFGRSADARGLGTGEADLVCEVPHQRWRYAFDGAVERTTTDAAARGPVGAGQTEWLRMSLDFEAISPVYDMFAALGLGSMDWGHVHYEQGFTAHGVALSGGKERSLQGFGYRDHSVGARDLTEFGGDHMLYGCFPGGRVFQALSSFDRQGTVRHSGGYVFEDGETRLCQLGGMPALADPTGAPRHFRATMVDGEAELVIEGEALHAAPFTIHQPNDWSVGTDRTQADPLVIVLAPVRLVWPDGEIGYGTLERNQRRSTLTIPA